MLILQYFSITVNTKDRKEKGPVTSKLLDSRGRFGLSVDNELFLDVLAKMLLWCAIYGMYFYSINIFSETHQLYLPSGVFGVLVGWLVGFASRCGETPVSLLGTQYNNSGRNSCKLAS